MKFVLDSNVFFSALLRDSSTRRLLTDPRLELYVPDYFFEELFKYASEFAERMGVSRYALLQGVMALSETVSVVSKSSYAHCTAKAFDVCPDPADVDFFALAMSLGCPIVSQEKKLKRQQAIRVITIAELAQLLK
ncbi:hypothetical protein HY572_06790 [Candidatus Micrarchaeota archaeon]|nr:hypothetical protein [Candidatus Micrarchaeota archaeon]